MTVADLLPLDDLEPVDLAAVLQAAELARRVDRKYLVPASDAAELVGALAPSHRVLQIGGRRSTTYRSTYLDTDDLRLCRDHLQGRRLRWKARSRLYVEDRLCRFEVKVKGARGETVKHVIETDPESYGGYGERERGFVEGVVGSSLRTAHADLKPVLEVGYSRATLVDLDGGTRLTVDHGVAGRPTGTGPVWRTGTVAFDHDRVIVETKGESRPGPADRMLAELGHRPLSLSKYATAAALLGEGVADNAVRWLVGRGVRLHDDLPARAAS
ncbi:MAG TPA: polyphosphate polymerase domain-containing protein [Nocardioides sp.]|nr:polyphosphate polymerase domain-containing protein [Nocardioides sp.]